MSAIEIIGLLIAIFGMVAVVLFVVFSRINKLGKQRAAALIRDYPQHTWVETVNFFGRESDGVTQMRGNGTLLLTDDSLVFDLWMPKKRYIIPLNAITEITTPRSFLGKSQGVQLLRIDYTDEANNPNAIAWRVRNLDEMQTSIVGSTSAR